MAFLFGVGKLQPKYLASVVRDAEALWLRLTDSGGNVFADLDAFAGKCLMIAKFDMDVPGVTCIVMRHGHGEDDPLGLALYNKSDQEVTLGGRKPAFVCGCGVR